MRFLTTTAIAALITAPAFAGGLSPAQPEATIYQPAPVIASAFQGGNWTGGYVGANLSYGDASRDVGGSGAIGGVQAGYMYDYGRFVLGGEVSLNAADIDFDAGAGQIDQVHTLKLKAGYDMGRTLVYGSVGAAFAKGTYLGADYDETGYLVGLGLDHMVSENVSVGGAVNYHRFDDINNTGADIGFTTIGVNVNYRF